MPDFVLSYLDSPEKQAVASLVRTWESQPDQTEAPTFRNMVAALFGIRGVQQVALFLLGHTPMFLVRGPHCWFDVTATPVMVKRLDPMPLPASVASSKPAR